MTCIQEILDKHPEAATWHQEFPWFSIGHVIAAQQHKKKPDFETNARRAAIFAGDIPRLHWLLNQPQISKEDLLDTYPLANTQDEDVSVNTGMLATPTHSIAVPPSQEYEGLATEKFLSSQGFDNHSLTTSDLSEKPKQEDEIENELTTIKSIFPPPSLSPSLAAAADSFKNDRTSDDSLLFETAYQHTIDYFASQGIRLEGEPAQDDRFGQQLKTFTSWLRQMKPLPNIQEPNTDLLVETHAAHSLQKGEVVTEPMVDILLKQGKEQQALQVLEKLRLLHPEKSLYFAARCQQIKLSEQ